MYSSLFAGGLCFLPLRFCFWLLQRFGRLRCGAAAEFPGLRLRRDDDRCHRHGRPLGRRHLLRVVDNRAEVDALCATDEEYIAMKLDFIRVMAGVNKLSVEEYLRRELRSGCSVIQETDLYYDTEYCVGVFGLDADGTVTTGLARSYFRTETFAPSAECQFIIQEVACTASSIEVEVGASDASVRYYASVMSADEFSSYDTVNEAVSDIIFSAELFDDVDWSDPSYTHTGRNRLLFEGLEASTEYVVIVFGISSEGEQTTEAATATFSTTAA